MTVEELSANWKVLKKQVRSLRLPWIDQMTIRKRDPFQVLISCILSLRTQDKTTEAASRRLFQIARTPETLAKIPAGKIERTIYPVGFYRVKAKRIREMSKEIATKYGGTGAGYHRRAAAFEGGRQKNRKSGGNRRLQPRRDLRGYPCSPDHEPVGADQNEEPHPDRICPPGGSPQKILEADQRLFGGFWPGDLQADFAALLPVPGEQGLRKNRSRKKQIMIHRQGAGGRGQGQPSNRGRSVRFSRE